MIPINEFFLRESTPIATGESGNPETRKTTPEIKRVEPLELELTYMHNPTVFNATNKVVQTIMSAKHYISAKDKRVQSYFDKFIKNLGNSGSDLTWDELLASIFKHQIVFGKAFIENITNKKGNRVVDWDIVDPKSIVYAKDSNNKIVVDKFGNPVGYFQVLPYNDGGAVPQNQKLPPKVSKPFEKSLFIDFRTLAQIKLYTVGDEFYPIGLIEPIYKDSLRNLNIKDALANAIYRHGFPIIWAKLGDLNHEPNAQQIVSMLSKLKDINFKQEIATPYYYDLQILESKKSEKMQEHINYFQKQIVTGMGVPSALATGNADGATYATLNTQSSMFMLTLRDLINMTTSSIEKYMFGPVCESEGFKEIPQIKWDIVGSDELDKKAKRILKYVQAGILNPDSDVRLKDFIKKIEQIDYSSDNDSITPDMND